MRRPPAVARDVTQIVKGDLEPGHLPVQERSWSVVSCSRDLPGKAQSVFSKKIPWWTRHAGKRERDGALTWREYIGYIRRDSSNTIKGLSPYQILGNLTSQTHEERYEGCWKKGSIMRSQPLYQQIHDIFSPRRTYVHQSSTRSLRQESRKIGVFSKNEKGYAPFLYHIGFSRSEDSITSGGLVTGGIGTNESRKSVYVSLVSPLDPCSDPKHRPYIHEKPP